MKKLFSLMIVALMIIADIPLTFAHGTEVIITDYNSLVHWAADSSVLQAELVPGGFEGTESFGWPEAGCVISSAVSGKKLVYGASYSHGGSGSGEWTVPENVSISGISLDICETVNFNGQLNGDISVSNITGSNGVMASGKIVMGEKAVVTGNIDIQSSKEQVLGGTINGDVRAECAAAFSGNCKITGIMSFICDSTLSGNINAQRITVNNSSESLSVIQVLSGSISCTELRNDGSVIISDGADMVSVNGAGGVTVLNGASLTTGTTVSDIHVNNGGTLILKNSQTDSVSVKSLQLDEGSIVNAYDIIYIGDEDSYTGITGSGTINLYNHSAVHSFKDGEMQFYTENNGDVPKVDASVEIKYIKPEMHWSLTDGVLTISGVRETPEYTSSNDVPWWNERNTIKKVIIEEGITGTHVFLLYGCSALETVVLPVSLENIYFGAFWDCNAITDVYYAGTTEQWNNINIEELNGTLGTDAVTIHYNWQEGSEDNPSDESEKETVYTITPPDEIPSGACIILAYYSEGNFKGLKSEEYKGESITFTVKGDCDKVKVMYWNSLSGMKPLYTSDERSEGNES